MSFQKQKLHLDPGETCGWEQGGKRPGREKGVVGPSPFGEGAGSEVSGAGGKAGADGSVQKWWGWGLEDE